MKSRSGRVGAIWGVFLILLGVILMVEVFVDLTAWAWVAFLTAAGFGAFGIYLTDRSDRGVLIPAYVLWVIAGLVALIELAILRDETVAVYVLIAIALPFLVGFSRNRTQRGFLIPAYVLFAVAGMIALQAVDVFEGNVVTAYIMFAIAVPFIAVYARDTKQKWALFPGGIMAIIGLSFLLTADLFRYAGPAAVILVGIWILYRAFFSKAPASASPVEPPAAILETEESTGD